MRDRKRITSAAFMLMYSSNVFLLSSHSAFVVALSLAFTDPSYFAIGGGGFGRTGYFSLVSEVYIFSGSVRNKKF